jgi:hypothetical protein
MCLPQYRNPSRWKRCSRRRVSLLWRWLALVLLLGIAPGCGLGDYEERLKEENARAKLIDEDNKHLGNPLVMPGPKANETGSPALAENNVFLRAPKVFFCKTAPIAPVGLGNFTGLCGYVGQEGFNVMLAGIINEDIDQPAFQKDVWLAFHSYLRETRGLEIKMSEDKRVKKKEKKQGLRAGKEVPPVMELLLWIWDEPEQVAGKEDPKAPVVDKDKTGKKDKAREGGRYWFYFYKSGNHQVAVIYQVPAESRDDPSVRRGIDASIKTLAVGTEAVARRGGYVKWK